MSLPVSVGQARAHVLRKQGLAGDGLKSVPAAVDATGGVYGTAPTCYLSCAARIPGFQVADLDHELYTERSVVRLRAMRGMAYIEPLALLPALFACTGEARDKTLKRVAKYAEMTEVQTLALADRIEAALEGCPPMTVKEIREALGGDLPGNRNALQMTVALLGRHGRIVRTRARGTWRSDLYPYARWTDWLGAPVEDMDPAAARAEVARRYLRAYGPATAEDLKWWTGWTKRDTLPALAALGEEATPVSLDGTDAWALTDELDALTATSPGDGRGVRLLPVWDSYFMGYATKPAGRARQVREEDYPRVYDKIGNATSVVVRDGMAAGVWELDADGGTLTVAPFDEELPWDDVAAQAAALGQAIGTELKVVRAHVPGPLSDGPRNTFLSPISLRS
ncbi:Winged helix DNA-binding domain-containing protein [Thermomonospora echinospora]|uniref:Winged helix DNA-binding domain-containing protein n=1 Tax=Thermomonospora echinospora TaxID=1992 RepID=A0A1H5SIE0_9ACTN|nr:winged helix DNA-binding domain-containing protein [Thermomonospora echinospora]SEF50382.1 Winged helix DNA-binding domain-containing protein [Thermomonospora echinospora]